MGLIINRRIQELMQGYPTVSDKYDVAPAVLTGADAVAAGYPVKYTGTPGRYAKLTTAASADLIRASLAGFILATNVKVPSTYPAPVGEQSYVSGDAFNLFIKGFIAVPLDADASIVTADAVAAVAGTPLAENAPGVAGVTYYTRSSSSAGAGHLNDGDYAYTKVTGDIPGTHDANVYFPLTNEGADAKTDYCVPGAQVAIVVASGKCTTSDKISSTTVVGLNDATFTGVKETLKDGTILAEICYRV